MSRLSLRFSLLVAMFCLPFLFAQSVSAGAVTSVKTFSVGGWSQGATLTKKYFVYTDWNGSSFKVVRCNRPSGNKCKSSAYFSGKPSSMYYGWNKNTEYVQAILKENYGMICLKLSTMKKGSGCGSMVKSSGLSVSGDIKGARQGWVKYDKYYLRGYGNNGGMQNYIWLFNSSKKLKKKWPIPLSGGEVEDVMVDGDTGQVWFTWYGSSRHITYYKVSESVSAFSVIKPLKDSSSNNNSGGSSGGNSSSGGGSSGGSSGGNSSSGGSSNSSGGGATHVESNYDGSISTILFGDIQDDGNGCGVYMILNLILDILTYGVGIAAIIGISISGITYLTAKGNEQQTIKAKRRIYEIVIGLVAYAALYAALNFLMPGGSFNPSKDCKRISEKELAAIREKEQEEKPNSSDDSGNTKPGNNSTPSKSDQDKKKKNEPSELGKRLLKEMEKTANEFVRIGVKFDNNHGASTLEELYRTKKSHCSSYIFLTMKRMGILSNSGNTYFYFSNYGKTLRKYGSAKKDLAKNFVEIKGNDTIKNLVKKGKLVPGDICGDGAFPAHTIMYAGKSGGYYRIHSFGSGSFSKKKHYNVKVSGSHKIGRILHAK